MRHRLAGVGVFCVVMLLGLVQGVAGADTPAAPLAARPCGDIPSRLLYEITTQRVTCAKGRTVARQWAAQCAQIRTGSCLVTALFYCRYRTTGFEAGAIRCIDERDLLRTLASRREVRFVTGV